MPIVAAFLEAHSESMLNIFSTNRVMSLMEDHVDAAVRMGELEDGSLAAVKLSEVTLLNCTSLLI